MNYIYYYIVYIYIYIFITIYIYQVGKEVVAEGDLGGPVDKWRMKRERGKIKVRERKGGLGIERDKEW